MTEISEEIQTSEEDEKKMYADFKRKLNLEAASAQVSKLEFNLTQATVSKAELRRACQEANRLHLGAVCVLPNQVKHCVHFLGNDPQTSLVACISFPHGGDTTKVKIAAVKTAVKEGVDEAEVTVPVSQIKDGNWSYVKREFKKLKNAVRHRTLRINIESQFLTPQELTKVCAMAADCGVTSLRTSSCAGYESEVVAKMKSAVKDRCTIKADGVSNLTEMQSAVDMGAGIIGSRNALDLAELILGTV